MTRTNATGIIIMAWVAVVALSPTQLKLGANKQLASIPGQRSSDLLSRI
jgi:hypothetical protein